MGAVCVAQKKKIPVQEVNCIEVLATTTQGHATIAYSLGYPDPRNILLLPCSQALGNEARSTSAPTYCPDPLSAEMPLPLSLRRC